MKRTTLFAMVSVCLVTWSAAAGSDSKKRPSQWRLDERLADRFDRAKIAERDAAYRARNGLTESPSAPPDVLSYGIDGSRNPELFLPHELFDGLLTALKPDAAFRLRQQAFYAPGVRRFAYDEHAFWQQLEAVSQDYLTLRSDPRQSQEKQLARCQARHRALQEARQSFGGERFDEFLYTVVAPATQSAITATGDAETRLRDEADGCPR